MTATSIRPHRSLPKSLRVGVWLCAFISPTAYFLLLLGVDRFGVQGPPEAVVWSLFSIISLVGLLVGGCVAWFSTMSFALRISAILGTFLGMLLQFGIIIFIIAAATGFAQ